jgi:hypothetical protein
MISCWHTRHVLNWDLGSAAGAAWLHGHDLAWVDQTLAAPETRCAPTQGSCSRLTACLRYPLQTRLAAQQAAQSFSQLLRQERPLSAVLDATQQPFSTAQLPAWAPTAYLDWYIDALSRFQEQQQLGAVAVITCLKELIRWGLLLWCCCCAGMHGMHGMHGMQ